MMNVIKRLGQAVGIDGDDVRVLATVFAVVVCVGLLLVVLAAFAGIAVLVFDSLRGL